MVLVWKYASSIYIYPVQITLAGPDKSIVRLPGTIKNFCWASKIFSYLPRKCIRYIGKPKEIQYFVAEILHRTSRSNFDLSSPALAFKNNIKGGSRTNCTIYRFYSPQKLLQFLTQKESWSAVISYRYD